MEKLAHMIRLYRRDQRLTLKCLSAQIGVSLSSLQRVEAGGGMDGTTLAAITRWMMQ